MEGKEEEQRSGRREAYLGACNGGIKRNRGRSYRPTAHAQVVCEDELPFIGERMKGKKGC
eukprot:7477483-Pyramimonas_sp.AAC.1